MKPENAGSYGNWILYRMCEECPRHDDPAIVSSKIWLIGRAYAAAVERGSGKIGESQDGKQRDFHDGLAKQIVYSEVGKKLDGWLQELDEIKVLSKENIYRPIRVHRQLDQELSRLIQKLTGQEPRVKQRPSFVSKYLHFHRPQAFFIFDTRAKDKISNETDHADLPSDLQGDYAKFAYRCLAYITKRGAVEIAPRQLDNILLGYPEWSGQYSRLDSTL